MPEAEEKKVGEEETENRKEIESYNALKAENKGNLKTDVEEVRL